MDRKYQIDTVENRAFLKEMALELLNFGKQFPSPEGGAYYLGDDGTPWKDRPRETWITCRMAHVYSLGTLLGYPGSQALADAAIAGIRGELQDREHGGWYAGRTAEGGILPDKACYAHAFVILAASSAVRAGRPGSESFLQEAMDTYDRFFWNEKEGLSCDTWNTEFTVLDDYRGLNANMHSVEAFLAAADVTGNEIYRQRAGRIIEKVAGWAEANEWRTPEHYTKEWIPDLDKNGEKPDDPFKPYGATPGHGIEWARLVTQWALSSSEESFTEAGNFREKWLHVSEMLYNRAISDGWKADGEPGICYTTDWKGRPVVHDRMHWTLCEAINTSALLWHLTGKEKYAEDYASFLQYLDEKVRDHRKGSWFHQLDRQNRVIGTVWPGKSDLYHAFQACLIPYADPKKSISCGLQEGWLSQA